MYKNSLATVRLPLIVGLTLAAGILIGAQMFGSSPNADRVTKNFVKFREILTHIEREYVDTVNLNELTDYALTQMLDKLDPHSVYIPVKEVVASREPLEGNFDGIGIEFYILKDTIQVVSPISGGPSEAAGLKAGDRIIKVDGKDVAGIKITNTDVFKKLRGPKGTKVNLSILRPGSAQLLDYTITRDKIPMNSVDVAYMVDDVTGYIKVSRFSATTYKEFEAGLVKLRAQGMKQLMLDLRGNPGGYMSEATKMVDALLPTDKLIVYTKSKDGAFDQSYRSSPGGLFESGAVVVLIDEGSASASEIVSGALQDNDRALLVGRRSFGKGLVQMPMPLSDGSELRLTISRYYTPAGRSIQKPYVAGSSKDYEDDFEKRFKHGEFFHADSIKFNDSLKYKTQAGRTVYGGGGIMPDMFVPLDTTGSSKYLAQLNNKSVLREFAFDFINNQKPALEKLGLKKFLKTWDLSPADIQAIIARGEKAGIKYNETEFKASEKLFRAYTKAFIGRGVWREEAFFPVLHKEDEMFQKAYGMMPQAKALLATRK